MPRSLHLKWRKWEASSSAHVIGWALSRDTIFFGCHRGAELPLQAESPRSVRSSSHTKSFSSRVTFFPYASLPSSDHFLLPHKIPSFLMGCFLPHMSPSLLTCHSTTLQTTLPLSVSGNRGEPGSPFCSHPCGLPDLAGGVCVTPRPFPSTWHKLAPWQSHRHIKGLHNPGMTQKGMA